MREFERAGQEGVEIDFFADHLAGGGGLAFVKEVAAAELFGREADGGGDLIHLAFERENALRRAEAAEGSVRRRGGSNGSAADADVGTEVRAGGMDGAAREHDGRESAVCAAVDIEIDLDRGEFAIARDAGAMAGA